MSVKSIDPIFAAYAKTAARDDLRFFVQSQSLSMSPELLERFMDLELDVTRDKKPVTKSVAQKAYRALCAEHWQAKHLGTGIGPRFLFSGVPTASATNAQTWLDTLTGEIVDERTKIARQRDADTTQAA